MSFMNNNKMKERLAAIDVAPPRHVGVAVAAPEPAPVVEVPKTEVVRAAVVKPVSKAPTREVGRGAGRRKLPDQLYEAKYRRQTFYVDDALIAALDAFCLRTGENKSQVVRDAIAASITKN
jgi:Ribbon-helix-helix protein, copG family